MTLTAADIMETDFEFIDCDETVAFAENLLASGSQSALPVLNPDRTVFGTLGPKELLVFAQKPLSNPRAFHAWEICNTRFLAAFPHTLLDDISGILASHRSGTICVTSEEGELLGVIDSDTLVQRYLLPTGKVATPLMEAENAVADMPRIHEYWKSI